MEADNVPARRPAPASGGTVEPINRVGIAKDLFQTPIDAPAERFELRDRFAEITYRANTFPEMAAKADQLGSIRVVAVNADGKRSTMEKVDGEWLRGQQHSTMPERSTNIAPTRDEASKETNVVPTPAVPVPIEADDAKSVARIDAQAERSARVARIETALMDRYVIKRAPVTVGDVTIGRTEYRFRGDTSRVAFTESTFRLATDTNSPSVARSMVDVAEARNWRSLRISGNEDFKRMVWLEASVRGVKTVGYEPNPGDLEVLKKEHESRLVNRIEPSLGDSGSMPTDKPAARGGGGRKAVLAAIEAVLVAKQVPEKQREAVLAAATEKLAQRIREGNVPRVKVYDRAAPSQRSVVAPTPEVQRSRERSGPAR